jgi:hypothetical protein
MVTGLPISVGGHGDSFAGDVRRFANILGASPAG